MLRNGQHFMTGKFNGSCLVDTYMTSGCSYYTFIWLQHGINYILVGLGSSG